MNIFRRLVAKEWNKATRLGCPAGSDAESLQRRGAMALLNPNGFRTPPKIPRVDSQGLTRGDRKRAARQATNAKIQAETAARIAKAGALAEARR